MKKLILLFLLMPCLCFAQSGTPSPDPVDMGFGNPYLICECVRGNYITDDNQTLDCKPRLTSWSVKQRLIDSDKQSREEGKKFFGEKEAARLEKEFKGTRMHSTEINLETLARFNYRLKHIIDKGDKVIYYFDDLDYRYQHNIVRSISMIRDGSYISSDNDSSKLNLSNISSELKRETIVKFHSLLMEVSNNTFIGMIIGVLNALLLIVIIFRLKRK